MTFVLRRGGSPPVIDEAFSLRDIRQIRHIILRENFHRVIRSIRQGDWGLLRIHLRQIALSRLRSVHGAEGGQTFVDLGDGLDTRRGYDYQLEHMTNGWKVIGVGYRTKVQEQVQRRGGR